jgi:hypothetical protein
MLRSVDLLMLRPPSSRNFPSCPVLVIDEDTAVFCSVLRQLLQQLTYASRHSLMLEISDCQLSLCNKSSCLDYFSHSPCIDIALANR